MKNYASKVINVAKEQVGYLEKASPYNEDSKTGNAGYNNYTKYGRDLVEWIGYPYADGVYWCDEFVDWCFIKAYGLDEAKKLLGGWSAYCPTSVQFFKDKGQFYKSNPKKGDVIFFYDSEGDVGHTGIVYDADGSYVYTIEGNTSSSSGVVPNGGGVFKKSYLLNNSRIYGYGRPAYDIELSLGEWIKGEKGGWRYRVGTTFVRNKWKQIDGAFYYFKADGYIATDEYIKSSMYKMTQELFYLDKDGKWDNKTYKWHKNDVGWWLECVETGDYLRKSWAVIDGKTYRFDSKGYMVHGRTVFIEGKKYTFADNGALIKE